MEVATIDDGSDILDIVVSEFNDFSENDQGGAKNMNGQGRTNMTFAKCQPFW